MIGSISGNSDTASAFQSAPVDSGQDYQESAQDSGPSEVSEPTDTFTSSGSEEAE